MSPISKNFVRASLIYFCISAIIGGFMIFWGTPRPAYLLYVHGHIMLLGWMSMMIYGVGFHILPRFSGNPVAYPWLSEVQFYLANVSLVGLVVSYIFILTTRIPAEVFAALQIISVFMFVVNIWCSIITPKEA